MDKSKSKCVIELLREAEEKLQQAIAETAMLADYGTSKLVSEVARELQQIERNLSLVDLKSEPIAEETEIRIDTSLKKEKRKVIKRKKSKYPKFEIRKGVLVRIGWSKKEKKEYIHKAPKTVFDLTISAMEQIAEASKGPIMAEEIIEHLTKISTELVPSYQVYLVIGFLREFNCIKQIGREGYEILPDLANNAEVVWKNSMV